jgi:hypothetical protein
VEIAAFTAPEAFMSPLRTPPPVEALVVDARRQLRAGPAFLAPVTGVPERTISRILARAGVPGWPTATR